MTTRIIVGLLALPFVLAPIWFGGVWVALFFVLVGLVGGYEWYTMLAHGGQRPFVWIGLPWIALLILTGWQPGLPGVPLVITAGLMATLIFALFVQEQPLTQWLVTSTVAIYLGLTIGQALALRLLPNGLWWLLFGLLLTWINDSAAYFAGVTLGRRKLWPRLSPKKTWEGTISGWLAATLAGALFALWTPLHLSIWMGALLGASCGFLALFGDLSISMAKRQVGVKDTSNLLPGHGGVLDRLDSLLFVMPFIYQFVHWWG